MLRALLAAILLVGCTSAPADPPMPSGETLAPTPTVPPARPPGAPTPQVVPHELGDPGRPAEKRAFAYPDWLPVGYLEFDADRYQVIERTIHGTRVVVPIDRDLLAMESIGGYDARPPEELATFLFEAFDASWHLFDGHLYDEVRFPVRGPRDPCSFRSATPVGYPICFSDHASAPGDASRSPHPLTDGRIPELVTHEMFHMWNGGAFGSVPRNVTGFPVEAWFSEGATSYYAARLLGREGFDRAMRSEIEKYERALPEAGGLSFQEIADRTVPPRSGPSPFNDMLYARGALVSYLLDAELLRHGASLDALMARMYEQHALPGEPYDVEDLRAHADTVAGTPLDGFWATWVDAGADFEGDVLFLERPRRE